MAKVFKKREALSVRISWNNSKKKIGHTCHRSCSLALGSHWGTGMAKFQVDFCVLYKRDVSMGQCCAVDR